MATNKRNRKPSPKSQSQYKHHSRAESPILSAILIDGGFYRHRAKRLFGNKTPEQRANEIIEYSHRHITKSGSNLYRIYYYDCPPSDKVLFHPLRQEQVNLAKTNEYTWMTSFLKALVSKRKIALRRGEELQTQNGFNLKVQPLKKLLRGNITVADLSKEDFTLDITQKGVDMKLGLDIAGLAYQGKVNQIIMISGDTDFVPAAKIARRAGIDFILDPMWSKISDSLNEHVDGIRQCVSKTNHHNDRLHISKMKE